MSPGAADAIEFPNPEYGDNAKKSASTPYPTRFIIFIASPRFVFCFAHLTKLKQILAECSHTNNDLKNLTVAVKGYERQNRAGGEDGLIQCMMFFPALSQIGREFTLKRISEKSDDGSQK